jgi:hypothetical protein
MSVRISLILSQELATKIFNDAEKQGMSIVGVILNHLYTIYGVDKHIPPKATINPPPASSIPGMEGNKINWRDCKYHAWKEAGVPYCYKKRKNLSYLLTECQECSKFEKRE